MKCGPRSSSLAPEGKTSASARYVAGALALILRVRLVGDQRPVSDGIYVHALSDLVSLEVRLGEDMVILKFLEPDVFAAAPVLGIAEREQTEQAAVDRTGVARRAAHPKPRRPDDIPRIVEHLGLGSALKPVPRHFEIVLPGLALDSARIAFHEYVAPVPAPEILPLGPPETSIFDLSTKRGQNRHEAKAR